MTFLQSKVLKHGTSVIRTLLFTCSIVGPTLSSCYTEAFAIVSPSTIEKQLLYRSASPRASGEQIGRSTPGKCIFLSAREQEQRGRRQLVTLEQRSHNIGTSFSGSHTWDNAVNNPYGRSLCRLLSLTANERTERNDKMRLRLSSQEQQQKQPVNALMPDGGLSPCVIKVIGVGGGGSNAIDRMMEARIEGVEFWAVNTDTQALGRSKAKGASVLNIGMSVTRGLGAGGNPEVGRLAAEESREDIAAMVSGADMVFVTSGMGGGTGSGAAPVVSEIARECGALTVGIVTKPFAFEGRRRMKQATEAIARLKECVDTVILVSNNKLLEIIPENTPLERSFAVADDILRQGVVGISEIIVRPGLINVDFADVRSVMHNAGTALMGIGTGTGKTRAEDAAAAAISSPLLDSPIERATGIVFNIIGGRDMSLVEVNRAAKVIYKAVDEDANIIFGALIDDTISDGSVSITVLATGFREEGVSRQSSVDGGRSPSGQSWDMPDFLTSR